MFDNTINHIHCAICEKLVYTNYKHQKLCGDPVCERQWNRRRRKFKRYNVTCEVCGKSVVVNRKAQRTCGSQVCMRTWRKLSVRDYRKKVRYRYLDKVTCIVCGNQVQRRRYDQSTCSVDCQRTAHNKDLFKAYRKHIVHERDRKDQERERDNYKRVVRYNVKTGRSSLMPAGFRPAHNKD